MFRIPFLCSGPHSARVWHVGGGLLAIADFPECAKSTVNYKIFSKDCFGVTPKPTLETRALRGIRPPCGRFLRLPRRLWQMAHAQLFNIRQFVQTPKPKMI